MVWLCRAFCCVEVSKTSSSSSSPSSSPSAFEIRWLLRNSPEPLTALDAPLAPLAPRLLPRLVPLAPFVPWAARMNGFKRYITCMSRACISSNKVV